MTSYCSAQRISLILAIIGALAIIAGITLLILGQSPAGVIVIVTGFIMGPIAYMEWSCQRRERRLPPTIVVEPPAPLPLTIVVVDAPAKTTHLLN